MNRFWRRAARHATSEPFLVEIKWDAVALAPTKSHDSDSSEVRKGNTHNELWEPITQPYPLNPLPLPYPLPPTHSPIL